MAGVWKHRTTRAENVRPVFEMELYKKDPQPEKCTRPQKTAGGYYARWPRRINNHESTNFIYSDHDVNLTVFDNCL